MRPNLQPARGRLPACCKPGTGSPTLHRWPSFLAAVLAAVILARAYWPYVVTGCRAIALAAVVFAAGRLVGALARFIMAPAPAKRSYPRMIWAGIGWHSLTRNLALARVDRYATDNDRGSKGSPEVRHLRARFRADPFGFTVRVKTIPGTGLREIERESDHFANAWRAVRVSVSQPKPGRVVIRAMRRDPLTVLQDRAGLPAGVRCDPARLYLGTDEWGQHRYLQLAGKTGLTIGGLPGCGKSQLIESLLYQWAPFLSAQPSLLDGKGSSDHSHWRPRLWLHCGDDLQAAVTVLEKIHAEMRARLASVLELTGRRNAWHFGPMAAFPLLPVIFEECQFFLDLAAYRGRKDDEELVRRIQWLTAEITRKGRSVLCFVVLASQKLTTDSLPSAIGANAGLAVSFATRTVDAAVAALGADIRDHPGSSPVGLQDDAYIGTCTTTMRTGLVPFTRVRVPAFDDDLLEARAAETAGCRRDVRLAAAALLTGDGVAVPPVWAPEVAQRSPLSRAPVGRPA